MLAIGLMSGTSLDGIDAALIDTDGEGEVRAVAWRSEPWSDAARAELMAATEMALTFERPRASPPIVKAEALVTRVHMLAVRKLLNEAGIAAEDVGVIGFHGQTIAHRPDRGWTWQIGDGAQLAKLTGITTVNDFRSADVAAGGQGAPLIPIYHAALAADLERPVALLNLGGVANMTFIGADGALTAFDTGPANGMLDQWVGQQTGARFDEGGALGAAGRVDEAVLAGMMDHPYFDAPPPKSLDRFDFPLAAVHGLSAEDGAATLTAFTAQSVARRTACAAGAAPAADRRRRRAAQSDDAADDRRADRVDAGTGRSAWAERRRDRGRRVRLYGGADAQGPADQLSGHDRGAGGDARRCRASGLSLIRRDAARPLAPGTSPVRRPSRRLPAPA